MAPTTRSKSRDPNGDRSGEVTHRKSTRSALSDSHPSQKEYVDPSTVTYLPSPADDAEHVHEYHSHLGDEGACAPSPLGPVTTSFEWGGPYGALFLMWMLPAVVIFLTQACEVGIAGPEGGVSSFCPAVPFVGGWDTFPSVPYFWAVFDVKSAYIVLGWVALKALFAVYLPGKVVEGVLLRDGKTRLKYKLNGLLSLVISVSLFVGGWWAGLFKGTDITDRFMGLAGAMIVFSYTLGALLYFGAMRQGSIPSLGGNSGEVWYDFFVGRELNPRIGDFDLKFFFELRPGLAGWVLINLSFALAQYESLGYVTNSMILVNIAQAWYVFDSVLVEDAVLTTIDIVYDGFGWMLAFGDIAWVPFTYSIQARFLAANPTNLSTFTLIGIVCVHLTGYTIFRLANLQKNLFRKNPNDPRVKHLKFLETKAGSRLITSGWWGTARHINYLGDWIMAVSWSLPCGFTHIIPYYYPIYFLILLIHRELRDEEKCHRKYGKDWEKYCELVPYRIFPGIY